MGTIARTWFDRLEEAKDEFSEGNSSRPVYVSSLSAVVAALTWRRTDTRPRVALRDYLLRCWPRVSQLFDWHVEQFTGAYGRLAGRLLYRISYHHVPLLCGPACNCGGRS